MGERLGRRGAIRAAPLHADAVPLRGGDGCLWRPVVDVLWRWDAWVSRAVEGCEGKGGRRGGGGEGVFCVVYTLLSCESAFSRSGSQYDSLSHHAGAHCMRSLNTQSGALFTPAPLHMPRCAQSPLTHRGVDGYRSGAPQASRCHPLLPPTNTGTRSRAARTASRRACGVAGKRGDRE
jgi:hypothetical protein